MYTYIQDFNYRIQEVIAIDLDAIKYRNDNLDNFGREIQDIDVCVGYNGQSESGMVVAEMEMVTGWKPNLQSLHDIDCELRREKEMMVNWKRDLQSLLDIYCEL